MRAIVDSYFAWNVAARPWSCRIFRTFCDRRSCMVGLLHGEVVVEERSGDGGVRRGLDAERLRSRAAQLAELRPVQRVLEAVRVVEERAGLGHRARGLRERALVLRQEALGARFEPEDLADLARARRRAGPRARLTLAAAWPSVTFRWRAR